MPYADAPPVDRLADLVAEATADPHPPSRLLGHLRTLAAAGDAEAAALGVALFESIHYRLPAFSDDDLLLLASRLYASCGRHDAAFLLAGLAVQLRPLDAAALAALRDRQAARGGAAEALPPEVAAKAEGFVQARDAGPALLRTLEALDNGAGRRTAIALFEAVWPRVRPMAEYWVYHRMSEVYGAEGRGDAAALLATIAIQLEPFDAVSDVPHRLLLRGFRAAGRLRDAAELCVRRHANCREPRLLRDDELSDLLAKAGPLLLSPPRAGRSDRPVKDSDVRPPRLWRAYGEGLPVGLDQLQREMVREPVSVAELRDAEVLIDRGPVAVFGADGAPHTDLSLVCFPPLLRRRFIEAATGRDAPEELETDAAVLISDAFPSPNLCHFLLDHVTRLELYRLAGVEIDGVTVIGPDLRHDYQRVTAQRMGVRNYVSVDRRARLRVGRLWVSSNCHKTRHPANWAADWAVRAVRSRFDLVPRRPARRLLVSRRDTAFRRIRNEAQIAYLLETLGFEVIVPGELSFAEQIAAFRDATHVVSPHGAGLTNVLWCAPGTHVLEVFHPHYGTWAYAMLNDVLDIDYASLVARDAESDAPEFNDPTLPRERTVPHAGRDTWLDPNELERWLVDTGAL